MISIPPEITAQIFETLCSIPGQRLLPDNPPLVLTRVSREWRQVAQSTSKLWTRLILPPPPQESFLPVFFSELQKWLSYSATRHLTISGRINDHRPLVMRQYLTILSAHSARWRAVEFNLNCGDPDAYPTSTQIALPNLEVFSCNENDYNLGTWPPLHSLPRAPLLRHLAIEFPKSFLDMPISTTITSLHLEIYDIHRPAAIHVFGFLQRVSQCASLYRFTFLCDGSPLTLEPLDGQLDRIQFHRLTELTLLFGPDSRLFSQLLDHIDARNLEKFEFAAERWNEEAATSLQNFISHHSSSIATLTVGESTLTDTELGEVCAQLPNLYILTAWGNRLSDDAFIYSLELLFTRDGRLLSGQNICLEHLSIFTDNRYPEITASDYYAQIIDMIHSRWHLPPHAVDSIGRPISRLRPFRLGKVDEDIMILQAPEEYATLKKFRDEGLRVRFEEY